MAAKPSAGDTDWGTTLNAYLAVSFNADGTPKTSVFGYSAYTNLDSEDDAMLKTHAYKAATDGYVKVLGTPSATNQYIRGYVGTTDDPVGAGDYLDAAESSINVLAVGIGLRVAKDEYFEIRSTMGTSLAIYWKSIGTLSKPVDQD